MQGRASVLIWLTYLHVGVCIFGPSLGQSASDVSDFVITLENVVKAIATKAQQNHANQCDLVRTCNCSRTECYPRKNANNLPGSTCVYLNNNTACPTKTGAPCNSVRVNLREGYVRLPPLDFSFGSSVESVVQNTVCAQSNLDSTFETVYSNLSQALERVNLDPLQPNVRSFYTTYFGAVDGSFRFYPGRDSSRSTCNTYDPRIRPWYTGALSVLKDLVVLLDTGPGMRPNFSNFAIANFSSPLEVAKSMTSSVMRATTAKDRATIIPLNEWADNATLAGSLKSWTIPADHEELQRQTASQEIQNFIDSAGSRQSDGASNGASNFTAGFLSALSILNSSASPDQSLKVVILITQGNSQYPPSISQQDLQTAALEFQNQSIRLFVYELAEIPNSPNPNYNSPWGDVCCQVDGYHQKLNIFTVLINPMSSVTSYLTFLARSRIAANQNSMNRPYWQVAYGDAGLLGSIITVTYLAMSADGLQLIGVVGIDFQIAGFDKDFIPSVQSYLSNNSLTTIPQNGAGVDIPNCNFSGNIYGDPNQSDCGSDTTPGQVLCTQPDQVDLKATRTSLLCCDDCQQSAKSWWGKHKAIILSIALGIPGIVLFLILSTCTVKSFKRCLLKKQSNGSPPLDVPFRELCEATDDFDDAKIIDRGTFGVLYRAHFADENIVAIKWLGQPADRTNEINPDNIHTLDVDSILIG